MVTTVEQDLPGLSSGIGRLAKFFENRATRPGLLARRALGRSTDSDHGLHDRLVREMRGETRLDGSVGGAAVPTIWRAIELMELGHQGDQAGVIRVTGWILNLQEKPGAFGEDCTDQRHANKVCRHFIGGFFAAAPPNERLSPVSLPNGKVFRSEGAARFAVSCLALRAVLMAGNESRPGVQRHLESLAVLRETWTSWDGYFAPDAIVSALTALAVAPPPFRDLLPGLTGFIAEHQSADGTWPHSDLFHVLEALVAAGTLKAKLAVCQAVPALLANQHPDGGFGNTAMEERALIGLRALLWARTRG
jgi:hypothetical protein